jgi:hypothetical protein
MMHRMATVWLRRALSAFACHFRMIALGCLAVHLLIHAAFAIIDESWVPMRAGLVIAGALILPPAVMILWHEGGHAIAALSRGVRVNGLSLGPLTGGIVILWGRPVLRFYRRGPAWNAYISCRIPLDELDRLILAAGGPAATGLLGIVCLVGAGAFWWSHGQWNVFVEFFRYAWWPDGLAWSKELIVPVVAWIGLSGLLDAAINLQSIEWRIGKSMFRSDGWHIRRALRNRRSQQ